jgi:beta-mannosidase
MAAYLHNDSDDRWQGTLALQRLDLAGSVLDERSFAVEIEPRGSQRVDFPDEWHDRPDAVLLAECDGARGWWFFAPDRELDYPEPLFDAQLTRQDDRYTLSITAGTLLRDLCVFVDRLDPDAVISDQCITLLPGETRGLTFTSKLDLDRDALVSPPVLQCANSFGARGSGLAEIDATTRGAS